jgi:hypothetical protein
MVDYKKDTGSSATMMIRDTGTNVEFWLNSNNSSTFSHQLPWSYTDASGTSGTKYHDYSAGEGWSLVRRWSVTTDQNVTFRIGDTGTSGFGGPTSFTVAIDRASIPSPPSIVTLSGVTNTSVNATFTDGAANGAAIDTRQIGYGTSASTVQSTITSDRSTTITGLTPGTTYYFWARTHNAKGWSGYGARGTATTYRVPDAPDSTIVSDVAQTTAWVSFTDNGNGGSAILERRVYWNTVANETGIQSIAYAGTPVQVTGLLPATTYYFWARVRNAAGWSGYSQYVIETTVAGAYVLVGTIWKQAIPYVNVGGVWKLARPWSRVAGVWKETT